MAYNASFLRYLVACSTCGNKTNKTYARAHNGQCKQCATGIAPEPRYKCPQCGEGISKFKHDHHYVCEACYKQNDPLGYALEISTPYQPDW